MHNVHEKEKFAFFYLDWYAIRIWTNNIFLTSTLVNEVELTCDALMSGAFVSRVTNNDVRDYDKIR